MTVKIYSDESENDSIIDFHSSLHFYLSPLVADISGYCRYFMKLQIFSEVADISNIIEC